MISTAWFCSISEWKTCSSGIPTPVVQLKATVLWVGSEAYFREWCKRLQGGALWAHVVVIWIFGADCRLFCTCFVMWNPPLSPLSPPLPSLMCFPLPMLALPSCRLLVVSQPCVLPAWGMRLYLRNVGLRHAYSFCSKWLRFSSVELTGVCGVGWCLDKNRQVMFFWKFGKFFGKFFRNRLCITKLLLSQ